MKAAEPGTPEELFGTHKIENVLGDLEYEGSNLTLVPPEVDEEAKTNEAMTEESLNRQRHVG